jgi:hypothetical protein
MPVVAAVLFEFCLQETPAPGRKLSALRWLRPAEWVRIHLLMSASGTLSADEATRRVRAEAAARALYRLRTVTRPGGRDGAAAAHAARRSRRALRRAHTALTAAGFADPAVAAEVRGRVQVLTMTAGPYRLGCQRPGDRGDVRRDHGGNACGEPPGQLPNRPAPAAMTLRP